MPRDQTFESDGVHIAYDDVGSGPPVVLVHGFASNRRQNWEAMGWYEALVEAGRRVVALDCRGHGESDKPTDVAAYADGVMAGDVVALLDHLAIDRADVVGYSMGARISLVVLVEQPERVNAVVLGGIGDPDRQSAGSRVAIAAALEADDPGTVESPIGRRFRRFADRPGNDRSALAACMRASRPTVDRTRLASVDRPVLFVTGADDDLGRPESYVEAIPGAEAVVVQGRDHLTAVADAEARAAVVAFLERRGLTR